MSFPKDFIWGTATSSYQIEGARQTRGDSIWDTFSETEGKVKNGDTGDIACDHLNRYQADVNMMADLGINAYRFSTAWARILPEGTGPVNEVGLAFYDQLVDSLLEKNIAPHITLYHWDLPQALQDQGGWENPASIDWFCEYSHIVSNALGDRVKSWITHNEPFVASMIGNLLGVHAPGKQDPVAAYTVAHHLLISHGLAVPIIRENSQASQVGITLNLSYSSPETNRYEDRQAARRFAAFNNDWFLEPVFRGNYPADFLKVVESQGFLKNVTISDIAKAAVPMDFLGINYYTRSIVRDDPSSPLFDIAFGRDDHAQHTAMDWEVYPDGLLHTLLYVYNAYYPASISITENGCAYPDPAPVNGIVEDPLRTDYYRQHIDAVEKAIELGVPVDAYFAWSLMDNFEWAEGYEKRFGIYYVDFETQERFPKRSALYFRDRIQAAQS
ncbi:GH1 family beta-glucosidase [Anaerolineales bacterium]